MGLPPPRDGWISARNYGLTESLKMIVLGVSNFTLSDWMPHNLAAQMLPGNGSIQYNRSDQVDGDDDTRRLSHLVSVIRGLLPPDDAPIALPPRVKALIRDQAEEEISTSTTKLSLRQMRLSNIEAGVHNHVWHENGGVPADKFSVGDFGYIPSGNDFKNFVILGNVIQDGSAKFVVQDSAYGSQWSWKDFPIRHVQIEPYTLPEGVKW